MAWDEYIKTGHIKAAKISIPIKQLGIQKVVVVKTKGNHGL